MEVITIIAIILGPVAAIVVSRYIDSTREQRSRKMEIFRTLMRTRRIPAHVDHVSALNLIEIEFSKNNQVIEAWKDLFSHFGTIHQRGDDESINDNMTDMEIFERDRRFYERLHDERQKLLAKTLHAIANELNFKIEQLEIFEGGYIPQGWDDLELENHLIRQYVLDLYAGKKLVPIGVVDYTNEGLPATQNDGE